MKFHQAIGFSAALFALASCFTACVADQSRAVATANVEPLSNFPQSRLTIVTPDARQHQFEVWIADNEAHREQGLMFVQSLARDAGMVFTFDPPRVVSMWMKNTLIPLDMVFVNRQGQITRIVENAKPLSLSIISSRREVSGVLELKGGATRELGIRVGAVLKEFPAYLERLGQ